MKSEIDPAVIEGIVAIGRELMDVSRYCGRGETINISIEAREKLETAAKCLGLMERIIDEADKACNETLRKIYGFHLTASDVCDVQPLTQEGQDALKSMGENRFKVTSTYDGEE